LKFCFGCFFSNPENSFPFYFFSYSCFLWIIIILKSDDSDRTETLWIDGWYLGIYQKRRRTTSSRENQTNFPVINGCEAHGDLSFPHTHGPLARRKTNLWFFIFLKKENHLEQSVCVYLLIFFGGGSSSPVSKDINGSIKIRIFVWSCSFHSGASLVAFNYSLVYTRKSKNC